MITFSESEVEEIALEWLEALGLEDKARVLTSSNDEIYREGRSIDES